MGMNKSFHSQHLAPAFTWTKPQTSLHGVVSRLEAIRSEYYQALRSYGDTQEALEFLFHEIGGLADRVRRAASQGGAI